MGKVEEVARALSASDGANWDAKTDSETANGCTPDEQRDYWREKARVAIGAMREPTEVMLGAMNETTIEAWDGDAFWPAKDDCKSLFNAAIDAALSEDKEQG
jgi:hypothetical protein